MFDSDCVILHTPTNGRASIRLGGGEGWGGREGSQAIPTLVVCNMCLILAVSYYILLRTAEPQLGLVVVRDRWSGGVSSN